jgi:hypothetical protein
MQRVKAAMFLCLVLLFASAGFGQNTGLDSYNEPPAVCAE